MLILTYDLETSGFPTGKRFDDPSQPDILQFAAMLQDENQTVLSSLYLTLITHKDVPEGAFKVHGISKEKTHKIGVNPAVGLEVLTQLIDASDMIVGYNHLHFDNKVLTNQCRRVFEEPDYDPFEGKDHFDVINAATALVKKPKSGGGFAKVSLANFYQHLFARQFEGAHDAMADVIATNECFWECQRLAKNRAT